MVVVTQNIAEIGAVIKLSQSALKPAVNPDADRRGKF